MSLSLLSRLGLRRPSTRDASRPRSAPSFRYRPSLEPLEDRLVLSTAQPFVVPHLGSALVAHEAHADVQNAATFPLHVTGVSVVGGQLVATVQLGDITTLVPLTLSLAGTSSSAASSAVRADPAATTPILSLSIPQGIHLSLLGLDVDTSGICLNITATSGPGKLLGNLLTDIANLLNAGTPLSSILGGLTSGQLTRLDNAVQSLLNSVLKDLFTLGTPTSSGTAMSVTPDQATTCTILNLSLGPLTLHLLGLNVFLNNCAMPPGPVTVTVTAVMGPGNLLGNLLCDVANLLNNNTGAVTAYLNEILADVSALEGLL